MSDIYVSLTQKEVQALTAAVAGNYPPELAMYLQSAMQKLAGVANSYSERAS